MLSTILSVLLSIISIVSAFLLIGIILIQQSKSGGGLGAVSGGMTESMFGASAGNVLTKATTWIAAIFLVSTLFLATVIGRLRDDTSVAESLSLTPAAAESAAALATKVADEAEKTVETKTVIPAADAAGDVKAAAPAAPAAEQKAPAAAEKATPAQ